MDNTQANSDEQTLRRVEKALREAIAKERAMGHLVRPGAWYGELKGTPCRCPMGALLGGNKHRLKQTAATALGIPVSCVTSFIRGFDGRATAVLTTAEFTHPMMDLFFELGAMLRIEYETNTGSWA